MARSISVYASPLDTICGVKRSIRQPCMVLRFSRSMSAKMPVTLPWALRCHMPPGNFDQQPSRRVREVGAEIPATHVSKLPLELDADSRQLES